MSDQYVVKGSLQVGDLNYPSTDGSNGDVLTTDGAGNISLQAPSATGAGSVERVRVDYNSSFDITSVTDETAGVTTTVTNSTDSIIEMAFSGHAFPPVAMTIYSFDPGNNRYTIESPDGFGTGTIRYVQGNDNNFGSFSSNGPIEIQVDENNLTGLSTGLGDPTNAYILMWFLD